MNNENRICFECNHCHKQFAFEELRTLKSDWINSKKQHMEKSFVVILVIN